jgi:hypothetical protein
MERCSMSKNRSAEEIAAAIHEAERTGPNVTEVPMTRSEYDDIRIRSDYWRWVWPIQPANYSFLGRKIVLREELESEEGARPTPQHPPDAAGSE